MFCVILILVGLHEFNASSWGAPPLPVWSRSERDRHISINSKLPKKMAEITLPTEATTLFQSFRTIS